MSGPSLEEAERNFARSLMLAGRRDAQAVRRMSVCHGVTLEELLLKFPQFDRATIRSWRTGKEELPEEVVTWTYELVRTGAIPGGCQCGGCCTA